jgi:3-hydroxyisobutyrate dehydrogenase
MERPRVAIIGTGIMGGAMAERLLDKGFAVDVWDRTAASAARIAERGAVAHGQPVDAVRAADVVITMLPTAAVLEDVMLAQKVLDAMRSGSVWAQMGTIGVDATDRLTTEAANRRRDVDFVDAPVSGTRGPARNGQLTILASGPDHARGVVQAVFEALGQKVMWLGRAGMGMRMKLILNTWLAFEIEAAAEIRESTERLGVSYEALVDTVGGGPMASPLALARLDKMQKGDDSIDFPLEWALKDLDLTMRATGTDAIPVAGAIAERWRGLVADGFGRQDVTAARLGLTTLTPTLSRSRERGER